MCTTRSRVLATTAHTTPRTRVRVFDWSAETAAAEEARGFSRGSDWVASTGEGRHAASGVLRAETLLAQGIAGAVQLGWARGTRQGPARPAFYTDAVGPHQFRLPAAAAPGVLIRSCLEALATLAPCLVAPAGDVLATAVLALDTAIAAPGSTVVGLDSATPPRDARAAAGAMATPRLAANPLDLRVREGGAHGHVMFAVSNADVEQKCKDLREQVAQWSETNQKLQMTLGELSAAKGSTEVCVACSVCRQCMCPCGRLKERGSHGHVPLTLVCVAEPT